MLWKSLIAFSCVIGVALAEQTPVFLWGANSIATPALHTVPQAEFETQLAALLKDHMVVAFEENGLSNKDFLCSNADGQSCYAKLQDVSPKTYYTSVENPSEALRAVAAHREHNSIDKSGQLANPVKCQKGTALFVTLDDDQKSRASNLESHDAAIAALTKQFDCNVAYLYMAAPSTSPVVQRRVRRATAAAADAKDFISGNTFRIYYTGLMFNKEAINVVSMSIDNTSDSKFAVKLATANADQSVTFDISRTNDGYFNLLNVAYGKTAFRSSGISAPTTFSYFCGDLILESSNPDSKDTLTWSSVQFQAPFSKSAQENFAFGDAWHCVGFVTPGILMGLLVVLILLVIVFIGVCWMMDINTMDRFDDPKGKTITVNASAD